jgi:hypothetical protein
MCFGNRHLWRLGRTVGLAGVNMNTMGNLFDEHESKLLQEFKSTTPEQLAKEILERKIKREYEALHTSIETDADRANKEEYPDDESEL